MVGGTRLPGTLADSSVPALEEQQKIGRPHRWEDLLEEVPASSRWGGVATLGLLLLASGALFALAAEGGEPLVFAGAILLLIAGLASAAAPWPYALALLTAGVVDAIGGALTWRNTVGTGLTPFPFVDGIVPADRDALLLLILLTAGGILGAWGILQGIRRRND